jgi:thioredoxin-dependent peroxiredoxin
MKDAEEGDVLKAGDQAPEFSAKDQHGNTVSLRDLRGKSVVLWFYPKADTPG